MYSPGPSRTVPAVPPVYPIAHPPRFRPPCEPLSLAEFGERVTRVLDESVRTRAETRAAVALLRAALDACRSDVADSPVYGPAGQTTAARR
jgi:hypothetical protein